VRAKVNSLWPWLPPISGDKWRLMIVVVCGPKDGHATVVGSDSDVGGDSVVGGDKFPANVCSSGMDDHKYATIRAQGC
jgi:hypothetical protein